MELIKQGYNECFPASVAMVTGKPVKAVMSVGLTAINAPAGEEWGAAIDHHNFWSAARAILVVFLGLNVEDTDVYLHDLRTLSYAFVTASSAPNLSGRGILTIDLLRDGKLFARHAVAFEDGVIFDGNATHPMPYATWLDTMYKMYNTQFSKHQVSIRTASIMRPKEAKA